MSERVEVGWRLRLEAWGAGYATEGAREALRTGFETLGLDEIVSFVDPGNERSLAVTRRLGMTRGGRGAASDARRHDREDPLDPRRGRRSPASVRELMFDLVIFDCDGVLVDSERIAVPVDVIMLERLGWPLTEAEVIERFVGRSEAYMRGRDRGSARAPARRRTGRPSSLRSTATRSRISRRRRRRRGARPDRRADVRGLQQQPRAAAPLARAHRAATSASRAGSSAPSTWRTESRRPTCSCTRPRAGRRSCTLRGGRGQRFWLAGCPRGGYDRVRLRRRSHAGRAPGRTRHDGVHRHARAAGAPRRGADCPKRLGRPQAAQGHWSLWRSVRLPDRRARPPRPDAGGRVSVAPAPGDGLPA